MEGSPEQIGRIRCGCDSGKGESSCAQGKGQRGAFRERLCCFGKVGVPVSGSGVAAEGCNWKWLPAERSGFWRSPGQFVFSVPRFFGRSRGSQVERGRAEECGQLRKGALRGRSPEILLQHR